ncbi:hypothetical protein [Spirulina sp.]
MREQAVKTVSIAPNEERDRPLSEGRHWETCDRSTERSQTLRSPHEPA